jgi:hypothetical protein
MATTYERAPSAIQAMVERAIEQYHPELAKVRLTVDTVIVTRLDKDEQSVHALSKNGYPTDAKISVTSLVDRARGLADAKLMIDGLEWNAANDRQRAALIDHELEHLDTIELKPTKKEPDRCGPKYDDLGRPCLKIRPHDWELAGFKDVAERHGHHSPEARQFSHFRMAYAQLNLFPGNEVLAIAEGKKSGVESISVNGVKLDATTIRNVDKILARDKSKACRNRHHASCRADGCKCRCHSGAEARA